MTVLVKISQLYLYCHVWNWLADTCEDIPKPRGAWTSRTCRAAKPYYWIIYLITKHTWALSPPHVFGDPRHGPGILWYWQAGLLIVIHANCCDVFCHFPILRSSLGITVLIRLVDRAVVSCLLVTCHVCWWLGRHGMTPGFLACQSNLRSASHLESYIKHCIYACVYQNSLRFLYVTYVVIGTDMELGNGLHQVYNLNVSCCTNHAHTRPRRVLRFYWYRFWQPVMSHKFTKSAAGESFKEMKTTEVSFTICLRWLFCEEPFQEWPLCDCQTCIRVINLVSRTRAIVLM